MKDQRIFRLSVDGEHLEIEHFVMAQELDRDAMPVIVGRLARIATAFEALRSS